MGCTGSTNALPPNTDSQRPLTMPNTNGSKTEKMPSPVMFVVPLNDEKDSLIKKHPPKRFQRLEEQPHSPPALTLKMLEDKLAEAEQRRLQILNERIESAKVLMKPKYANGTTKLNEMMSGPQLIDVEG